MVYNYYTDKIGKECLFLAHKSKGKVGFGAILIKNRKIIGRGWNHQPQPEERGFLTHVDYAIHAEQSCVVDALRQGIEIKGSEIYVLGLVLRGSEKGKLTVRKQKVFICKKCSISVLIKFDIPVNIPHVTGWIKLSPQVALKTSEELCGDGYWNRFASP